MSAVTNQPGRNLWTAKLGQLLEGQQFNDVLHAIHNSTTLTGGLGKDHFHVNMTPASAVTGTKIKDFNATQGDRLVLDGITKYDSKLLAVTLNGNGHDYDIAYNGKFVATVNLQYTPEGQNPVDWNPGLEKATEVIKRMVRGGQLDAMSDYYYGTEAAQKFVLQTTKRTTNILNFDPEKDTLGLDLLKNEFQDQAARKAAIGVQVEIEGEKPYITVSRYGAACFKIQLMPEKLNAQNLYNVIQAAKADLGID